MKFRAIKTSTSAIPENNPAPNEGLIERRSLEWNPQESLEKAKRAPQEKFLDTPYDVETLRKRLTRVAQDSKSFLDEQGYTILFLALGFLEWYESPSDNEPTRAPLVLIPVELKRGEIREIFSIQWTNEEILTNISLKEKLKEQGIFLPDFEMPTEPEEIDEYFKLVKKSIQSQSKWRILSDIYLDFFSFTKFVMWKDLDSTTWPDDSKPITHQLIQAIFAPDPNSSKIPGFDESEVDKKIRADSVYHILDADSSQIAAIEDIKAGKNLVIQGPPGTGKSQTIANAIADLLAQGKTVLFISEKMAALEVVKERLDRVGLGDFCLELHSKKANIKDLHQKLQKALNFIPPREIDLSNQVARLESLKKELNNYSAVVYTPIGNRNLTPYTLYGLNEVIKKHFSHNSREMVRFQFSNAEKITEQEWEASVASLHNLGKVFPKVRPVQQNPWYGCNPGVVHPADESEISILIQKTNDAFYDLQRKMEALATITGLSYPDNINDLKNAIGSTKLFVSPNPIDRNLLLNDSWNLPNEQVGVIIDNLKHYQNIREQILQRFKSDILDFDIESFLKEFRKLSNQFVLLKAFNSRYKQLRQQAYSLYLKNVTHPDNVIINDFTKILNAISVRDRIRIDRELGKSLFGSLWCDENSNPEELQEFSEWIIQFRRKMLEDVFTEKTVDIMSHGVSPAHIEKATNELSQSFQEFQEQRQILFQRLNFSAEKRFSFKEDYVEFQKYQLLLSLWEKNIPLLQTWSNYAMFSQDCSSLLPSNFIEIIEEQDIFPDDIIPTFEGNYVEEMLRKAFKRHPALSRFLGDAHEEKIQSFVELDQKIIEYNRLRLIWKLCEGRPDINAEASPNSELGILKQQFERKRSRMPIRQLIKNTSGLIQKITPCFMMGPLSVALFLDPRAIKFDVIIFDEASQVRPEDALGALLRGNQAAIIGDSRQLPPTTFFDKIILDEIDDVEAIPAVTSGIESILNLCNVCFPSKTLRWHYRSKHETLIALSNEKFYDNRLFVYPSPMKRSDYIGLTFVHSPKTSYDRGRSQINRGEAKIVANAVFEHYKQNPSKSLGVGTFNIKQQQAIIDEVDALRLQNPEMEQYFREDVVEKFFIKNLETIQGDERDVIFLSVGYGKDIDGRLYQNFGPLNQEGGERRLNVLMTRARQKCVVFSNFTFRDLKIAESSGAGIRILKDFLQFAETGEISSTSIPRGDSESPFEDAVYEFLVTNNYEVHKQIGCAGFRIDMAVVDSQQPGRYLVGIECDGAQYHSSKVARDRDRLRQQILNGLGWEIHRIWSTDWYRNPAECKLKLLKMIENKKNISETNVELSSKGKPISKKSQIDDLDPSRNNPLIDVEPILKNDIQEYQFFNQYPPDFDIYEISQYELDDIISNVVATEGPIHFMELIKRLRDNSINKRFSPKCKDQIERSIQRVVYQGKIRRQEEFLWQFTPPLTVLRRRKSDQVNYIDWICDQEIEEAIVHVLQRQFATSRDDLITSVLRIFGFLRKTERSISRINNIIENKIKDKKLCISSNGKIDIKT
jgi:superfamily I DNA and/or RNA helicase/very-short-patch-repair endonuclease